MFIRDIYTLKESKTFEIKQREEIVIDLELEKAPLCDHTILKGKVLYRKSPVKNAVVMVMDNKGTPVSSAKTDDNGDYKFLNILKPGKYKAIASAVDYETSETKSVTVSQNKVAELSFELKKGCMFSNGIIYGKILESGSLNPVDNAEIYLKSLQDDKITYKTESNQSGQYLIYNVMPDEYNITVQKVGYQPVKLSELKVDKYSRISLYFDLIRNSDNIKNTICGVIKCDDIPVDGVAVFLYLVDENENENIVQINKTNKSGQYLFSNIKRGLYIVKGKLQRSIVYERSFIIE